MNSSRLAGQRLHSADVDGALLAIARTLGGGDDHAGGAIVDKAIVEQMQRLAHEARALMLLDVERLAHDRDRIHRGMFAKGDRHRGERAAVGAVALEVASRHQRGARARRGHAEHRIFAVTAARLARAFAIAAASHYGTAHPRKADRRETRDRIGEPRVDDHRGPLDATRGEAAMRPGLIVGAKVQAEHLRQGVAVGANRRAETHDEAVEILAREPRVVERICDRIGGEIDRTAHQAAAVGRIADADDRGAIFQIEVRHS